MGFSKLWRRCASHGIGHAQVRGRVWKISDLRLGTVNGGTLELGDGLGSWPVALRQVCHDARAYEVISKIEKCLESCLRLAQVG